MILLASASTFVYSRYRFILQSFGPVVTAGEYKSVLSSVATVKPDILVLDLDLPGLLPENCVAELHALMPLMKIVVLAPALCTETELHALLSGARACCTYDIEPLVFRRMVVKIQNGDFWYRRSLMPLLMETLSEFSFAEEEVQCAEVLSFLCLTDRECEVAVLVAKGRANKVIARQLKISERTVKFHLTGIFRKLGITGRLELLTRLAAELDDVSFNAGTALFADSLDCMESESLDTTSSISGLGSRRRWLQQLANADDYRPSRTPEPRSESNLENHGVADIWH